MLAAVGRATLVWDVAKIGSHIDLTEAMHLIMTCVDGRAKMSRLGSQVRGNWNLLFGRTFWRCNWLCGIYSEAKGNRGIAHWKGKSAKGF